MTVAASIAASYCHAKCMLDGLLVPWCPLYRNLTVEPVDLTGRNVIVTGANSGIGLEVARKMATFGANVTLACRNAAKGEEAKKELVASTGNANIDVRVLDVSSFASIKAFAESWGSKPIDILINNAGQPPAFFNITDDGLESSYVANFLSQVLLTELLLTAFAQNARVIQMSSITNYLGTIDPADLDRSNYIRTKLKLQPGDAMPPTALVSLYADAKLCQLVYTRELQKRLDESEQYSGRKIVVHATHPGLVNTALWGKSSGAADKYEGTVTRVVASINLIGTEQGSCTAAWLATDPKLSVDGGYYYDRQYRRAPHAGVPDAALRATLWEGWHLQTGLTGSF